MEQRTKEARPANKRFTVTITPEIESDLLKLKREQFFNQSRTEMIQFVLKRGLEPTKEGEIQCSQP